MRFLPVCAIVLTLGAAGAFAASNATYDAKCKACHKADGSGIAAMKMKPLGSPEVQAKSDAELKKDFTQGVGKMKPIAGISDKDAAALVAYLRTFKQ